MSDLRFTDTNAADDSAGRVFGLDGNLYLPVVFGLVAGVLMFAGLGFAGAGYPLAGAVAAIPVGGSLVWVLGLRQGKPAGYDRDKLDQLLGGADFTKEASSITHTNTHATAPDGRFIEGMLVFGSPERGGVVAKGFRLEPPDLRGASFERLNANLGLKMADKEFEQLIQTHPTVFRKAVLKGARPGVAKRVP